MRCFYCNTLSKAAVCSACAKDQANAHKASIWSNHFGATVVERQKNELTSMERAFAKAGFAMRPNAR